MKKEPAPKPEAKPKKLTLLRFVCQVIDTPKNRKEMLIARSTFIAACDFEHCNAVAKIERITLFEFRPLNEASKA